MPTSDCINHDDALANANDYDQKYQKYQKYQFMDEILIPPSSPVGANKKKASTTGNEEYHPKYHPKYSGTTPENLKHPVVSFDLNPTKKMLFPLVKVNINDSKRNRNVAFVDFKRQKEFFERTHSCNVSVPKSSISISMMCIGHEFDCYECACLHQLSVDRSTNFKGRSSIDSAKTNQSIEIDLSIKANVLLLQPANTKYFNSSATSNHGGPRANGNISSCRGLSSFTGTKRQQHFFRSMSWQLVLMVLLCCAALADGAEQATNSEMKAGKVVVTTTANVHQDDMIAQFQGSNPNVVTLSSSSSMVMIYWIIVAGLTAAAAAAVVAEVVFTSWSTPQMIRRTGRTAFLNRWVLMLCLPLDFPSAVVGAPLPPFCVYKSPTECHGQWQQMEEVKGTDNPFNGVVIGGHPPANAKGDFARLTLVDSDADNDMDAYVGNREGNLLFLKNLGSPTNPNFVEQTGEANPLEGIDVGKDAAPTFVDNQGEGNMDLYVGNFDGNILFFKYIGSPSTPNYEEQKGAANPFNGVDVGTDAVPTFVDIDKDGDMDAFVGNQAGNILFFKNTGNATSPLYEQQKGVANPFNGVDVGSQATPTFVDIDKDGDMDAFVGNYAGDILFFKNFGSPTNPSFKKITGAANPLDGVYAGSAASPAFADTDADGYMDCYVANSAGRFARPIPNDGTSFVHPDNDVSFFKNLGRPSKSVYKEQTGLVNPFYGIDLGGVENAVPKFVDTDADGDMDVYVGESLGTILFLKNTGSATHPIYMKQTGESNPFNAYNTAQLPGDAGEAFPVFVDTDADGDMDAYVGRRHGALLYFKNTGSPTIPNYEEQIGAANPLNSVNMGYYCGWHNNGNSEGCVPNGGVPNLENAAPVFVDTDSDGDLDCYVAGTVKIKWGNYVASVRFYKNMGTPTIPNYEQQIGAANPFNDIAMQRGWLNLAFVDTDTDGDMDAYVGTIVGGAPTVNEKGLIEFFKNTGTSTTPVFVKQTGENNPFNGIDMGQRAYPSFVDTNGDIDMLVGNSNGDLLYFSLKHCQLSDHCGGKGVCNYTILSPSTSSFSSKCECEETVGPRCGSCSGGKIEQSYTYSGASSAPPLTCNSCSMGFWSNTVGYSANAICKSCEPGRMFIDAAIDCKDCNPGLYQSESAKAFCVDCSPGTYTYENKAITCKHCERGRFDSEKSPTVCEKCPTGYYQNDTAKTFCLPCLTGWFQNVEGQALCTACPIGWSNGATEKESCENCVAGKFQNEIQKPSCKDCSPGTHSSATSATLASTCVDCEAGKYSSSKGAPSSETCIDCPAGKKGAISWNPLPRTTSGGACENCESRHYRPSTSNDPTTCDECPSG